MVGEFQTTPPGKVPDEMRKLLTSYHATESVTFDDLMELHWRFERIHPFQDGNGRVGRIILFKECLANRIMPFIIDHEHKLFYYRGLKEYATEKGYLTDTCLSAQDEYAKMFQYFFPQEGESYEPDEEQGPTMTM